jgi:hypothetical protein
MGMRYQAERMLKGNDEAGIENLRKVPGVVTARLTTLSPPAKDASMSLPALSPRRAIRHTPPCSSRAHIRLLG